MNILFVSHFYTPHLGGVENHIKNISDVLKNKHKITLITSSHNDKLKKIEYIDGIKIIRIKVPKIKYIGLIAIWLQMILYINEFVKSDVIHIHDVFIWVLPVRILAPIKKFFVTIHGWSEKYPTPKMEIYLVKLASLLTKGSIAIGNYISEIFQIKSDYIAYGGAKVNSKSNKKTYDFVYVGRLNKISGLDKFIRFAKDNKLKYKIIGDGPLKNIVCDDKNYLGKLSNTSDYISRSTFTICSGYLTILEAMANRSVPIFAVSNSVRKNYIDRSDFCDRVLKFNSKGDLKKILKKINKINELEKDNYRISKSYTWEKIARIYERLWRK